MARKSQQGLAYDEKVLSVNPAGDIKRRAPHRSACPSGGSCHLRHFFSLQAIQRFGSPSRRSLFRLRLTTSSISLPDLAINRENTSTMNTRHLSTRIVLGFSILALTASALAAEPTQISMLRKSWEQARARAAQPVDESYLRELQKLLDSFTKAGQLEDAMAVKNESQSVVEDAAAASTAAEAAKQPAKLVALRKTWIQSRDKALQPSDAVYVRELQKLQDAYAKAGKLEDALAAKNELEKLGANSEAPSRQTRSFVGKKWATASGSQFTFKADGTGTQANASGKEWPLKWTQGTDDLLKVDGWSDDKPSTLYFRFPKSREGLFGPSADKLDKQLTVK